MQPIVLRALKFFILVVALAVLFPRAEASAAVVKNISTGWDDGASARLSNGTPDSDYIIGPGGTGGLIGVTPLVRVSPLPYPNLLDSASTLSRWLVPDDSEAFLAPVGTYFFQTVVDLTGHRAATAEIEGLRYAADNKLISVEVNGASVFSQPIGLAEEFHAFHLLGDLGLGLFQPGLNTIRFGVWNDPFTIPAGEPSALALRVEGLVTAAVPEPAGYALAALGGAIALLGRLRRPSPARALSFATGKTATMLIVCATAALTVSGSFAAPLLSATASASVQAGFQQAFAGSGSPAAAINAAVGQSWAAQHSTYAVLPSNLPVDRNLHVNGAVYSLGTVTRIPDPEGMFPETISFDAAPAALTYTAAFSVSQPARAKIDGFIYAAPVFTSLIGKASLTGPNGASLWTVNVNDTLTDLHPITAQAILQPNVLYTLSASLKATSDLFSQVGNPTVMPASGSIDLNLSVAAVPEPSTYGLLAIAAICLFASRRHIQRFAK